MIVSTTETYSDLTTGGVWSSSNPVVATIGASTGIAHGVSAGVVTFSYTLGTGCMATKVVSVNILGGVSPRDNEKNTIETTGAMVNVIPNPNKGAFTVMGTLGTAKQEEDVLLELTDMLGQTVYKSKAVAREGKIEEDVLLNNIANGMYLLNVRWEDGSKVMHVVEAR